MAEMKREWLARNSNFCTIRNGITVDQEFIDQQTHAE
jgi:hypothetical protein